MVALNKLPRAWGRGDRHRTRLRERADSRLGDRRGVGHRSSQYHDGGQRTALGGAPSDRASHAAGVDPRPTGIDTPGHGGLVAHSGQRCRLRCLDRSRRRGTGAAARTRAQCSVPLHGSAVCRIRARRRLDKYSQPSPAAGDRRRYGSADCGRTLAVAWDAWIGSAIAGAVLIGLFLAPLGMSFSLFIDDILPPARRAEGFALLRTSKSVGLIIASSVIAFGSLEASFLVSAALAFVSAIVIVAVRALSGGRKSPARRQDATTSQRS
jgi:hypothetical protein